MPIEWEIATLLLLGRATHVLTRRSAAGRQKEMAMFMLKDDMTKFPRCTALLKNLDATLKGRPKVLDAFLEVCKAGDQLKSTPQQVEVIARRALKWGTPPRLEVAEGMVKGVAMGHSFEGCGWNNDFGKTPFLVVTSFWFDAFEFGIVDRDKNAERLTRTVLHETVHWVRSEAGATDDAMDGSLFGKGQLREAGELFEERAFGVASVCTNAELLDAILSRRD
jgi:hypothetical protein